MRIEQVFFNIVAASPTSDGVYPRASANDLIFFDPLKMFFKKDVLPTTVTEFSGSPLLYIRSTMRFTAPFYCSIIPFLCDKSYYLALIVILYQVRTFFITGRHSYGSELKLDGAKCSQNHVS